MGKSKERKITNQNKQKEKMNQINESNIRTFNLKQLQEINGNNFITVTHTIVSKYDGSKLRATSLFPKRMLNFINMRMRTAVMVAVATKITDKEVIYDGWSLFCENS